MKTKTLHCPMFFQNGIDIHFVYGTDKECFENIKDDEFFNWNLKITNREIKCRK